MNKFKKFLSKNKGYLLASMSVILIYPLGFVLMNKHLISFNEFMPIIPVSFMGVLLFSLPFRWILKEDKE